MQLTVAPDPLGLRQTSQALAALCIWNFSDRLAAVVFSCHLTCGMWCVACGISWEAHKYICTRCVSYDYHMVIPGPCLQSARGHWTSSVLGWESQAGELSPPLSGTCAAPPACVNAFDYAPRSSSLFVC